MARGVIGRGHFGTEDGALKGLDLHRGRKKGSKPPLELKPTQVEVEMGVEDRYQDVMKRNGVIDPTVPTSEEAARQARAAEVDRLRREAASL